MKALYLLLATFGLVMTLGLQSLNVNGGHRLLSVITSFGIGLGNLTILKIMPGPTNMLEITAYLIGGPLGIVTSIMIHPWLIKKLGRKK